MDRTKILLIEDEPDLAEVLVDYLLRDGFDAAVERRITGGPGLRCRSVPMLLIDLTYFPTPGTDFICGQTAQRDFEKKRFDQPIQSSFQPVDHGQAFPGIRILLFQKRVN